MKHQYGKGVRFSIYLLPADMAELREDARLQGVSVNHLVKRALAAYKEKRA